MGNCWRTPANRPIEKEMKMGNMREISIEECNAVFGGTITVNGNPPVVPKTSGWIDPQLLSSLMGGSYGGYLRTQALILATQAAPDVALDDERVEQEPEPTPEPEIVVNGITAKLDAELHKKADNLTSQLLLMGTVLTGGIGIETALFAKLVGVVGKELAIRIAAGGALLGDLALDKAVNKAVYDVLLNNAIKDFQDDGRINSSTLQDWEAYNQFIEEYNAYVDKLSPKNTE
jgi:hypothetical protein